MMRKLTSCFSLFLMPLVFWGCYSFSGTTLPGHLKTIRIFPVEDLTLHPDLAENLNQRLVRGYQERSSLRLLNQDAHIELKVKLRSYTHSNYNVSGAQVVDFQINITAEVTFYDNVKGKMLYEEKNLPAFSAYSVSKGQTERDGQNTALAKLIDLILDNTVSGW